MVVKFKITDWPKDNTVLEYNFPCKKDDGFFFFPIAKVHELRNGNRWNAGRNGTNPEDMKMIEQQEKQMAGK